jgi:heme a synthase
VRNAPAPGRLPMLGWSAFFLVQFQGLLGGLRVVLFKNEMGIFHGALAQLFFVLLCSIVLLTNRRWIASRVTRDVPGKLRVAAWITTLLIFGQLVIGATMRHQHAGLAIPDFPLAYGEVWPATDPESVTRYNQQRVELISLNPITAFQIHLQMAHRIVAAVIFIGVAFCAWVAVRQLRWTSRVARCSVFWFGLITIQVVLGAATIWSNKAADIATLHVLVGALSLATGAMLCVYFDRASRAVRADACLSTEPQVPAGLPVSQATLNS